MKINTPTVSIKALLATLFRLTSLCLLPSPAGTFPYTLTEAQKSSVETHLPFGLPSTGELLFRQGYVVSHDNWLKIPRWVAYKLDPKQLKQLRRSEDFRPDYELGSWQRAELSDYRGSGFDRGHLAPAADMKASTTIISQSFMLSNIAPQQGIGFNRSIWAKLESTIRKWAEQRSQLWIITGPVFMDTDEDNILAFKLIGNNKVAVPTHFFKIIIDRKPDNTFDTLAFVLPNEKIQDKDLSEFIASIDDIERLTGLDFLKELPDSVEEALESRTTDTIWEVR